jgi:His/Glu/Gln/Arg/opine family amino acid ABC transporter permease subunit
MPAWAGPVATYLAQGLRTTALLALVSIIASTAVGVVVGTLSTLPGRVVRAVLRAYVEIWRGLPIIVLPQAARRALPPYVGLVVNLVQQTSLAAVIGLLDVLAAARRSIERLTLSSGDTHAGRFWPRYWECSSWSACRCLRCRDIWSGDCTERRR